MAVKVVDASALGALLFGEPDGAAIAARLGGARLIAPASLPFEVANICLKKMRRDPDQRDLLLVAFGMLARMEVGIVAVDQDEALVLAERAGLTAYDGSYLWLARQTRSELVTLDRRLAQRRYDASAPWTREVWAAAAMPRRAGSTYTRGAA